MKEQERLQARLLRKMGLSVKEIAQELEVSKGSVSNWVRDIDLSDSAKEMIRKRGEEKLIIVRAKIGNSNRDKYEAIREEFRDIGFDRASEDDTFRMVCAIYWGEGEKSRNTFSISNCDVDMIRVIGEWLLREGWSNFRFRVSYHDNNEISEDEIIAWWKSNLPFLEDEHIGKCSVNTISRASQRKGIGKQPYGTATISVFSTKLVQSVLGGIDYIKSNGIV